MGKSIKPKYRVVIPNQTVTCWWVKEQGKPTVENLEKHIIAYVKSQYPGGENEHIAKHLGYVDVPNWARIELNNASHQIVAKWKAPMFWVID